MRERENESQCYRQHSTQMSWGNKESGILTHLVQHGLRFFLTLPWESDAQLPQRGQRLPRQLRLLLLAPRVQQGLSLRYAHTQTHTQCNEDELAHAAFFPSVISFSFSHRSPQARRARRGKDATIRVAQPQAIAWRLQPRSQRYPLCQMSPGDWRLAQHVRTVRL